MNIQVMGDRQITIPLEIWQWLNLQEGDELAFSLGEITYLAVAARREGEAVVSFDRDFKRLNVAWVEPE